MANLARHARQRVAHQAAAQHGWRRLPTGAHDGLEGFTGIEDVRDFAQFVKICPKRGPEFIESIWRRRGGLRLRAGNRSGLKLRTRFSDRFGLGFGRLRGRRSGIGWRA
ncbi:hypothetical protein V9L20_21835 [Variovorax sp. CCNWLW225]|uniref:hypothetical protein n=1 Tax=Variovorax sp. CCNWLW225 TaxID=3127462 RepID=UPI0030787A78